MRETVEATPGKTYAKIGLVFYVLTTLGILYETLSWIASPSEALSPFILLWVILFWFVSIGFTFWAFKTYKKITEGNYVDTRTSSLILGISGLLPLFNRFIIHSGFFIFVGLYPSMIVFIGGFFFLLAYINLSSVLKRA